MGTKNPHERERITLLLEIIEDKMLDIKLDKQRISAFAEKIAAKLKEELKDLIPSEERLNEVVDKLPDDLLYFTSVALKRAVKTTIETLRLGIEEKIDMVHNNFLEVPKALELLPEELKKPLEEWWTWYNERYALPAGVFLHGGLRVCVTYNTARLSIICMEGCMAEQDEASCKEECKNYLGADHVVEHVMRRLQEILEDYNIKYETTNFTLGHTKYTCADINR